MDLRVPKGVATDVSVQNAHGNGTRMVAGKGVSNRQLGIRGQREVRLPPVTFPPEFFRVEIRFIPHFSFLFLKRTEVLEFWCQA